MEKSQTTVSDVLINELTKWDITLVFGIPGTSSLGLVEALRTNKKMRYIVIVIRKMQQWLHPRTINSLGRSLLV